MGRLMGGACWFLFLDLSKAFNTLDHSIIKLKLKALDIKESSVSWFTSSLSGPTQKPRVDKLLSDPMYPNSGVTQSSILGPLLFMCYVNELPKFCTKMEPYLYTDDTASVAKETVPIK